MTVPLSDSDRNTVRIFRRIAREVRAALSIESTTHTEARMVGGYIETDNVLEHYRPLCIPVRRAYLESDPGSAFRVDRIIREAHIESEAVTRAGASFATATEDLNSHTILGDDRMKHREIFDAWLEAAIFGDFADRDSRYKEQLAELGKPVEGIAIRLTEEFARAIVDLDDALDALGFPD